jgi:hypothetical protein
MIKVPIAFRANPAWDSWALPTDVSNDMRLAMRRMKRDADQILPLISDLPRLF